MSISTPLRYDITLPDNVNDIVKEDFWILDHVSVDIIRLISEPVKFTSYASIFVRRGSFKAEIDLVEYSFKAPCIVNIASGHILQYPDVSDDFDAAFLVLSKSVVEQISMLFHDCWLFTAAHFTPVVHIPEDVIPHLEYLYKEIAGTLADKDNDLKDRAIIFALLSFLFNYGWKCFNTNSEDRERFSGRLSERFLRLLREHFKKERLLDFYATQLQVTPKHLSRTVREQTGCSPVDWIRRYVIVEAKVLLRSTDLHVQQIADELNFASQSIFGKYFKKHTGLSPREFRNNG